jgi:hypothetical protein
MGQTESLRPSSLLDHDDGTLTALDSNKVVRKFKHTITQSGNYKKEITHKRTVQCKAWRRRENAKQICRNFIIRREIIKNIPYPRVDQNSGARN